jgi:hypothetical protein
MTTTSLRRRRMSSPWIETPRTRGPITVSQVLAPILVLVLLLPVALRIPVAVTGVADVAIAVAAALFGVVATDMTSGIVHWFCDTFFGRDTPVIGRLLIEPFRRHHVDPTEIVGIGLLRVNRANCLAMAAVLALLAIMRASTPSSPPSLVADAWLLGYSLAVVLTNQIHRWAHAPQVPSPVRWMQDNGILLNPAGHARHHATKDGCAFCITTGWLNPVFDRVVRAMHHPR